jgi:hypothetical protein
VISPPAKGFAFVIVQNVSLVGYVLATKVKPIVVTTTSSSDASASPAEGSADSAATIAATAGAAEETAPGSPLRHSDIVLVDISSMRLSD